MLLRRPFSPKPRPDRAPMAWPGPQAFAPAERCDGVGEAQPKTEALRSEPYRRLVAMLPCKVCGVPGFSQAAHPNTGKGAGIKTDDRECFALCCDRPGIQGCHPKFDQGALFTKEVRRALEPAWGADTRRQILSRGLWPKNLPTYQE
jgi:hypothetical protein